MDIVSALVTRLQERFKTQIGTVLPSLIDRLGDSKDQVRDQAQSLLLKIMDQAANPQYVWDRMLSGFRHKNIRSREAVCFCLIATLNVYGAQGLTLSKIVPHICHLLGDPASQVRDGAMNCLVEIYRHVGERVRVDLGKKGLPQSRIIIYKLCFPCQSSDKSIDDDESVDGGRSSSTSKGASSVRRTGSMRRPSSASSTKSSGKESSGAGAVDEEDFIHAFEDVPAVQIYSPRELEDSMNKIREILSDDKHDWEQRVAAVIHCFHLSHLSSVLGNRFDHGAENIMPTLLNLVPNSAKVMATSGMAAIRLIIRHTHYPRLIPIMTSNCTSKSVAVRRHIAVLIETIKKGVHDADSEARSVARKCYWGFHAHFSKEAELLFQALELTYQKALQSHLKSSDSIMSLPQSDRSSSSSQESLNSRASSSSGSLQRSRSDVDVNAVASAKSRMPAVAATAPFSSAAALPPGSYASLGRVRTRRQSSETAAGGGASVPDSRGRSRAKAVSQSQPGSRSSSPGKLLARSSMRIPRSAGSAGAPTDKRSKIPHSQGCSRETSPSRARDGKIFTTVHLADATLYRFGLIHQAMRILNTGTEVEAAVADALRRPMRRRYESPGMYSDDDANSDASSACSERSFSSRNGAAPHYLRQTEDVAEILNHCASSNWSERKEGLLGLQSLLKSQRVLSRVELKRLCEIFTRMFADPHSKVFSMFLETLVDFITLHREDLQDWLFILLTQLLKKMGADLLGSVQAKVQRALDVTRDSFPYDQQFNILMRFIVDQTQTPNLKVKVAILKYIESLARQMDPSDFMNSSETRLAVSRIITWTTEPKSLDVRKAAQMVLIALFELNTPEFTMLLGALPKTFQDGATKLLYNHLKNSSNASPSGSSSVGRTPPRHPVTRSSPLNSPTNGSHGGLSPRYITSKQTSVKLWDMIRTTWNLSLQK
uniref:Cytoplasmic linker associated protein 1 n=1 Tax=Cyprinus carpio TaxID=7962 RepID=A0A8C1PBY0_CYPCA